MILNDGTLVVNKSPDTDREVRNILNRIRENFFISKSAPEYAKIRLSEEYASLNEAVRFLQIFDIADLKNTDEQKAFWINLYNLLSVHGIVRFQINLTVWERPNFFSSTEYNIGGYRFSLYDILHGILRRNRRRWRFLPPPFRGNDPRVRFLLNELDPRIHFALHAGSRSCPALSVYHPDTIDEELDAAACRFLNSNQFIFDKQTGILSCSKIIKWYARDFGARRADRLAYLAQFVDDNETRDILSSEASKVSIQYLSYDWHLNSSG